MTSLQKQSLNKHSGNFVVASLQSAFAPWTANILVNVSENADRIDYRGGGGSTLKCVIHYFRFVNFMHLFQPSYSHLGDCEKLEYSV